MSIYSFQNNLLSAAKTGNPPLANTALSSVGVTFLSGSNVSVNSRQVGIVSLSTHDVGLSFTPVNFNIGTTVNTASTFSIASYPNVTLNVLGSVFNVPASLHNKTLAVVRTNGTYTVFPFLSNVTTVPLSSITITRSVATANTRRLRLLGY
jgi:hypothetical protein